MSDKVPVCEVCAMKVDMHTVPKFEKEGFMWKQGGKVKSWKRRWFILYGKHIAYFEKDDSPALGKLSPKGCIHIHDVKCEPTKNSKFPHPSAPFLLHANERVFLLVADTVADRQAWMNALKRVNDRPPAIFCPPCQRLVDLSRCASPLKVGEVKNCNSAKSNYLVLAQGHLAYYNAREDVGFKMALNLVHLNEEQCFVTQKSDKQFEIKLKVDGDVVAFESPECTKWVHTINEVILSDDDPVAVAAAAAGAGAAPNASSSIADTSDARRRGANNNNDDDSSSPLGEGFHDHGHHNDDSGDSRSGSSSSGGGGGERDRFLRRSGGGPGPRRDSRDGGRGPTSGGVGRRPSRGGGSGVRRREYRAGEYRDRGGERAPREHRDRERDRERDRADRGEHREHREHRDRDRDRDRERNGGGGGAVAIATGPSNEEFESVIIDFMKSRDGKSSTQEIMDHFKSKVGKEQSTAFSVALSRVSKFDRNEKVWVLK